jgi:vancomycin permeability regulator SanA
MWRRLPRPVRTGALVVAAVLAAALSAGAVANRHVVRGADGLVWDHPLGVPPRPVALVFGTELIGGRPGPRLADRLTAAVDLFRAGKVGHLLMTGGAEEVAAMRAFAVEAGVPGTAITGDPGGLDSYDSCRRARTVFGVTAAVVVTQAYHLARALWLCRAEGLDAVGLATPDWQLHPERSRVDYPLPDRVRHGGREWLARLLATVERIRDRPPAVGGPPRGLDGADGP